MAVTAASPLGTLRPGGPSGPSLGTLRQADRPGQRPVLCGRPDRPGQRIAPQAPQARQARQRKSTPYYVKVRIKALGRTAPAGDR